VPTHSVPDHETKSLSYDSGNIVAQQLALGAEESRYIYTLELSTFPGQFSSIPGSGTNSKSPGLLEPMHFCSFL